MKGRVFGLMGSMYSGFLPIGMAVFGPLADAIPLQWIMIGSGAALFLLAVLLVGLCTYQQYGITYDEAVERQSSIINYQYILKTLLHHDLQVVDQELATWKDRYYGVAFQLPMVLVEHLYNFTLPVHDVFVMRHLCTFLICFGGWVCLYVFLQKVFQNRWLSLLGLMMTVLYPRFFGEQFTNIKDMVFTAACCA